MKKKAKKKRLWIEYSVWEDGHNYIHKQGATDIDEGMKTLNDIIRKL